MPTGSKRQRARGHTQQEFKLTSHVTKLNVVHIMSPLFDGKRALRLELAAHGVVVEDDDAFQGTGSQFGQIFDLVLPIVYYRALVSVT